MSDMLDILNKYNYYKLKKGSGLLSKRFENELDCIEKMLNSLTGVDLLIIKGFYLNKVNKDKIASQLHISRASLYRKHNKLIKEMEEIYADMLKVDTF